MMRTSPPPILAKAVCAIDAASGSPTRGSRVIGGRLNSLPSGICIVTDGLLGLNISAGPQIGRVYVSNPMIVDDLAPPCSQISHDINLGSLGDDVQYPRSGVRTYPKIDRRPGSPILTKDGSN